MPPSWMHPRISQGTRLFAAACFTLLFSTSPSFGADEDLSRALQSAGIQPISPSVKATGFDLPRLGGGNGALAKFRGKPVLLHFWATWCGPCVAELPELDAFYRAHGGGKTFEVLAISSESRGAVEAFVKARSLTLPMLLDEDQSIASQYQATALPTTYVLDRKGHLVGVARGARAWNDPRMAALMQALATGISPVAPEPPLGGPAPPGAAPPDQAQGPVPLPKGVVPPKATARIEPEVPELGAPVALHLRLTWEGDVDAYALGPTEMSLPEGISQGATTSRVHSSAGNTLEQIVELKVDRAGEFSIAPMRIRYIPKATGQPLAEELLPVRFAVRVPTLFGLERGTFAITAAASLACLAGAALIASKLRRKRASASDRAQNTIAASERELTFTRIDDLRSREELGETEALFPELIALARALDPDTSLYELEALSERVRFGGYRISREELRATIRKLELLARMRFSNPTEN